jgi:Ca2+-binding RTX toxin-like protein
VPTTIAIESHPVTFQGIDTGFDHLYLVKTVTDAEGRVRSETVIRGGLGPDGRLAIQAGIPLAFSYDARWDDTLAERHHRVIDLGGRSASDVWNVMLQHARNIDQANLPYGFDFASQFAGNDANSNTVIGSVLHTVGISISNNLPPTVRPGEVPLYNQISAIRVDDVLAGTARADRIYGGVGNDRINGGLGDDALWGESGNDRLSGSGGSDRISAGSGNDMISGGSGNDKIWGGSGSDAFVFSTEIASGTNVDRIVDFSVRDDTMWLNNRIFEAAGPEGHLRSSAFWTGTVAHDATDRVIYDGGTGALFYDPDGIGSVDQIQFAQLNTGLKITAADFLII